MQKPYSSENLTNSVELNWGLMSETTFSGMLYLEKVDFTGGGVYLNHF